VVVKRLNKRRVKLLEQLVICSMSCYDSCCVFVLCDECTPDQFDLDFLL
jgi:hypothetical protein